MSTVSNRLDKSVKIDTRRKGRAKKTAFAREQNGINLALFTYCASYSRME